MSELQNANNFKGNPCNKKVKHYDYTGVIHHAYQYTGALIKLICIFFVFLSVSFSP